MGIGGRLLIGGLLGLAVAQAAHGQALRRPQEEAQPNPPPPEEPRVTPEMSPEAKPVPVDRSLFGPDPAYGDGGYDPKAQFDIYGAKKRVDKVHPLLELGQPLYGEGPLNKSYNIIGQKNLVSPQFYAYGDFRTVVAYNDNGAKELGQVATRLNLDLDLKLTATERIHALLRPLDRNGDFTRYEFAGPDRNRRESGRLKLNGKPETLFFEGDLGAITAGLSDEYVQWDLPFTFGLIPLVFQNGVWVDDAFIGGAFAIPAKSSAALDISNMDVTFFAGEGKVTSGAIRDSAGKTDDAGSRIFGVTTFIERQGGYIEAGYGYTQDTRPGGDFSYNNATLAYTARYGGLISNSVRGIYNWGQEPRAAAKTADGFVLLVENSFITALPSTLIPYANFFLGHEKPQSLLRDPGAGGVLKNTGINFETDNLTGFPKLDDSANDTYGGAVGLQYLFNLDQQIVVEAASVQVMGRDNKPGRIARGDQYAVGARYQLPVTNAWILRADVIWAWLEEAHDIQGVRFEVRRKF